MISCAINPAGEDFAAGVTKFMPPDEIRRFDGNDTVGLGYYLEVGLGLLRNSRHSNNDIVELGYFLEVGLGPLRNSLWPVMTNELTISR